MGIHPILSMPVGDMRINQQVPKLLVIEEGFEYENDQVLLQTCYRSRTDYKDFFICGWFVKIP
jgi:hypothetical protein